MIKYHSLDVKKDEWKSLGNATKVFMDFRIINFSALKTNKFFIGDQISYILDTSYFQKKVFCFGSFWALKHLKLIFWWSFCILESGRRGKKMSFWNGGSFKEVGMHLYCKLGCMPKPSPYSRLLDKFLSIQLSIYL